MLPRVSSEIVSSSSIDEPKLVVIISDAAPNLIIIITVRSHTQIVSFGSENVVGAIDANDEAMA
jgi:hypothetical protein